MRRSEAIINLKCFVFDELLDSVNDEKPLSLVVITDITFKHTNSMDTAKLSGPAKWRLGLAVVHCTQPLESSPQSFAMDAWMEGLTDNPRT